MTGMLTMIPMLAEAIEFDRERSYEPHPYAGMRIALATMHGKQTVIAPALASLSATLLVPERVDTDALGTFSGEVPRLRPALETAIAKARLAMRASGLPLGIATEGSFGPDPSIGAVPMHYELMVLVDDLHHQVVCESICTHDTNYSGVVLEKGTQRPDDLQLARWGFPEHALIVRSEPIGEGCLVRKGLRSRDALDAAIAECFEASPEGRVRIETDMRAHMNPTRMRQIEHLAHRMAARLQCLCPCCDAPGFGRTDAVSGLPCSECGEATLSILAEVHSCKACGEQRQAPRADLRTHENPVHCGYCNP